MLVRLVKRITPAPLKRVYRAAMSPDSSQSGEASLMRQVASEYECRRFLVDVGADDGVTLLIHSPTSKRIDRSARRCP